MNKAQLQEICKRLHIALPLNLPTRVYGGLVHKMWRIQSEDCTFAIKQLSKNINFTESVKKEFNLTEDIAHQYAQRGIPAIGAIKTNDSYLIEADDSMFLVYPWVNASVINAEAVSEDQALRIIKILASIHLINLDAPELHEPGFQIHTTDELLMLIGKAEESKCPFANDLRKYQREIIVINELYQSAVPLLEKSIIVSHGDLDPKNVLWDENSNPLLIDWEASRKLNPTYDVINVCLDWSGITTETFNKTLFIKMIRSYITSGGYIDKNVLQAAFYGVFGWINWMIYNIERTCSASDQEQIILGIEQVSQTLKTIIKLKELIPELINATEDQMNNIIISQG